MNPTSPPLTATTNITDSFGRVHNYLRISLTERCNLRCTYCMPEDGIPLLPKSHLMTYEEIFNIAKYFVDVGVTKIRLTGGEPLVRKGVEGIIEKLATLPVELSLTTNAVLVEKFIPLLKKSGVKNINVSLDSLDPIKNQKITRRDHFKTVHQNIFRLVEHGFRVKLNCVLVKGFNENEIMDFIHLSKSPLHVRFIEFMPFDGNKWDMSKLVTLKEILAVVDHHSQQTGQEVLRLADAPNDTAKNYQIKGYAGTFAVISSVTNPFCDSCNRIRLTADGKIKNCLFSADESDLLSVYRKGESILSIIGKAVQAKKKVRAGMDTLDKFKQKDAHDSNRSMIAIGG